MLDYSVARFRLTGKGFLPFDVGTSVEMQLTHIFEIRYIPERSERKIYAEIVLEEWRPLEMRK